MTTAQLLVLLGVILYGTSKPDIQKGDSFQAFIGVILVLAAIFVR